MKKIILLFTLLLFLMGCASTQRLDELDRDMKAATLSGGKVSSYTTLTQGNLADGDNFVARDISEKKNAEAEPIFPPKVAKFLICFDPNTFNIS